MVPGLRYRGSFLSRKGVIWRIDICQDGYEGAVGDLEFPAEEALVIDWPVRSKEDVLCGSEAVLTLISPDDRTYADLYTIEVGAITMDVYRNDSLYWSGSLDPEFYEEPYECARGYEVSFTFSDFGIFDRLKYSMTGMVTLRTIVVDALNRGKIQYSGLDETMISTAISLYSGSEPLRLDKLLVRSDNFYDEDGEASTLRETIEGILQPLGLRMIQRAGRIWIYDLNGLHVTATGKQVEWYGDSSTMGVDKVANNIKINWSTYARCDQLLPEDCWTEPVDANEININNIDPKTVGNCSLFSYHFSNEMDYWIDATDVGFTLWISREGINVTLNHDNIYFFKLVPQNDGSESEGIAISLTAYEGYKETSGSYTSYSLSTRRYLFSKSQLKGNTESCGVKLFSSKKIWIPPVESGDNILLRVILPMLLDCRFNPFEAANNLMFLEDWDIEGGDEKKDYDAWQNFGNFVYVPVTIKYQPSGSETVYCWTNQSVVTRDAANYCKSLKDTFGHWAAFDKNKDDNPETWGWLCYYDSSLEHNKCGVMGWRNNRPAKDTRIDNIPTALRTAEDGQYIPYPIISGHHLGGQLWIEVRAGAWMISDNDSPLATGSEIANPGGLWTRISHILFQLPQLELVNNRQFDQPITTDDVEYDAEVNSAAKEGIELDTICGTHKDGIPTSRGAYYNAETGRQIRELTRAGRTTQAEELLIGTLYSQYAARHVTLTGEVEILADNVMTYTEHNQPGKLFLLAGDRQDLITDTSDASLIELSPDDYDKR